MTGEPLARGTPEVAAFLGVEGPNHALSWHTLVMGDGIPGDLIGAKGLYAVYLGAELVYIGKSTSLCRRIGQLIAALCGGVGVNEGFHPAYSWEYDASQPLFVEVFKADNLDHREREAIQRFRPRFNRAHKTA